MPKVPKSSTSHHTNKTPYARPQKYELGQHGAKGREQKRLTQDTGTKVSGDTHQSEHPIGFAVANQSSGKSRKQNPVLDNSLPAYQEGKGLHRKHIGTGTQARRDESGFDSNSYRDTQRKFLSNGDASSAVQINQLGYAHNKDFRSQQYTPAGDAANNSYSKMVHNMNTVPYAQGNKTLHTTVDKRQKAEMLLARQTAQTGKFPTVAEENAARRAVGLPEIKQPMTITP